MKRLVLIDGNNLLFRSYYATAYSGNFMKNSKGFPTNALFSFVNMINKIIDEEKPEYMLVAFDKGKTFRHEKYDNYKEGRLETPDELKLQFPFAKKILDSMGIFNVEVENYEADDIIGTLSNVAANDDNIKCTIISSDKDLLQLIDKDVEIKLLKQKDFIRYDYQSFMKEFEIEPKSIVDLKALQGDSSDNIPGVKGIGEKTALKLIQEYKTLDNLYKNIDNIKGKLQEKLVQDKHNAYLSYELATIYKKVPLNFEVDYLKYSGPIFDEMEELFNSLEFFSLLKREVNRSKKNDIKINIVKSVDEIMVDGPCAVYLETLGTNYHKQEVLGMGIYNEKSSYYVPLKILKQKPSILLSNIKYTYDLKKLYVSLKWLDLNIGNVVFDTMLAANTLDYNVKEDISYLAKQLNHNIDFYEDVYGKENKLIKPSEDVIATNAISKAQFIYETYKLFNEKLKEEEQYELYNDVELPLSIVLGNMEYTGIKVDAETITQMGQEIDIKIELIVQSIYNLSGVEFNISSPKQLGEVIFEKIGLPHGKKTLTGYSTSYDVLVKLKGKHPIISLIMEYRNLTKLKTTYIEGLLNSIFPDGKIHTIYNQIIARTGRLSSIEPNLQNIPIRSEYGKLIRKAFIASDDSVILSSDYSQIELRVLAHIANIPSLIKAFNDKMDIHTKTAADIFKVEPDLVTKEQRRIAKAVNFGIIYGISPFGLSENLDISIVKAKEFIDDYFKTYPGIKLYMENTIKEAYQNLYVKTLFNRKRNLIELKNPVFTIRQQGERMALNTPIQGTSADIIKKAMVDIYKEFHKQKIKSKMILQVHDELVFDVIKEELEKVITIVRKCMEEAYELSVPLDVDIEFGKSWYHLK
jgi:DNA polymerase-1